MLQYLSFGTLPALDEKGRPRFAYGRTIHEHCPRRSHFDAGRFAGEYGDDGHREGWCLYKIGCKGPATHARCSTQHFGEVVGAWPIGVGHPCIDCTEQDLLFRVPLHETIEIEHPTPPAGYPALFARKFSVNPWATGLAGLVGGVLVGAGLAKARHISREQQKPIDDQV